MEKCQEEEGKLCWAVASLVPYKQKQSKVTVRDDVSKIAFGKPQRNKTNFEFTDLRQQTRLLKLPKTKCGVNK